jgi:hypothetical protein
LLRGRFSGQLAAVGASFGRVAVAAGLRSAGTSAVGVAALLQGRAARAPAAPVLTAGGLPLALARAYLGDAALATVVRGAISVRVERHHEHAFGPPQLIPIAPGPVTALTATMDFRSDVLLAWQQNGSIYAHMLRASGRRDPTQRVGSSAPDPQLQAVVSDNDHGMLAWSSTEAQGGSGPRTLLHVDLSGAGVRFGTPRLLASFADPAQVGRSPGSLALVRLASENVVMAWTQYEHGHYVVRAAPPVFATSRPSALLSDPSRQAVLADVAPGPAGEALALWTSTPRAAADQGAARTELWAGRMFVRPGDRVAERPPEAIAAPGAATTGRIAVDPADDRALAAWLTPGGGGRIQYSISRSAVGYRPHAPRSPAAVRAAPVHWLRIALGAAAALLVTLAALTLWLRRRRRQPAGG